MRYSEKNIDMLTGSLYRSILFFTIPIALSSMLQQLFNAADTAIVGLFDTSSSLAAVGTNGEIIALIVALSSGLSVGVNVLVAQQIGQHKEQNIIPIIRTAMSLAVMIGVAGLIIGQCISAPLLGLIKTPSDILASSVLYLRIYFVSYPFLLLYDFGSAILRACSNSRYPFLALTLSGIVNVFLNIIFVVFFKLGVSGVAAATVLSTMLSALLLICRLKKDTSILRICLVFSIVSSLILIEPLVIFWNFFAGFFSADQTVIQNACLRILCILFFEPLCNLYEIPAGVLRGTGHSLYPAVATIIGNCCFRIVWICTVFRHYHQLNILYYAFPISWVLTIILITIGFIAKKPGKTF